MNEIFLQNSHSIVIFSVQVMLCDYPISGNVKIPMRYFVEWSCYYIVVPFNASVGLDPIKQVCIECHGASPCNHHLLLN